MSKKNFDTNKRYCVNHSQNTVTISQSFQNSASRKGTPEYNIMMSIRKDFLSMEVTVKTYHKKRKSSSHLTYRKMDNYLECLQDHQGFIDMFRRARKVSRTYPDPYQVVRKWFLESFPDFDKPVRFDENGEILFRYVNTAIEEKNEVNDSEETDSGEKDKDLDDAA